MNIPKRYIPDILTSYDYKKQKASIIKSRKLYKKGIYFKRPKIKSFKVRKSKHLRHARDMYNIESLNPNGELAKKTKCELSALKKIVNKGEGAYYSSGSRPSQTAKSWGIARLASAITGDKASVIDYAILYDGCKPESRALQLATKRMKKYDKYNSFIQRHTQNVTRKKR